MSSTRSESCVAISCRTGSLFEVTVALGGLCVVYNRLSYQNVFITTGFSDVGRRSGDVTRDTKGDAVVLDESRKH